MNLTCTLTAIFPAQLGRAFVRLYAHWQHSHQCSQESICSNTTLRMWTNVSLTTYKCCLTSQIPKFSAMYSGSHSYIWAFLLWSPHLTPSCILVRNRTKGLGCICRSKSKQSKIYFTLKHVCILFMMIRTGQLQQNKIFFSLSLSARAFQKALLTLRLELRYQDQYCKLLHLYG